MKATELIRDLAELVAEHGDLELRILVGETDEDDWYSEREIINDVMVAEKAGKIELTVFEL